MNTAEPANASLNLRAGEIVEVRSVGEILATLDERARFEALPFMPEMLKFSGRRFRVSGRADRTCDRVERKGIRNMTGAVHLEGVRCDGAFHDGCDAACLIYWKEAWLKRAPADAPAPDSGGSAAAISPSTLPQAAPIFAATTKSGNTEGAERIYSCQATESLDYTTAPEPGETHSYWRDVRCGNVSWYEAARTYIIERFNAFQSRRGGAQYPTLGGAQLKTPIQTLDLQPGELVQIKTRDEIFSTLDSEARNRGLSFDREMLVYCGGTYRVLKRVTKIIDEPTGKMMPMKRDCVILDDVICKSRYHGLCQRAIYPFWREIWLERSRADRPAPVSYGEGSFVAFVLGNVLGMVKRRLLGN